MTWTFTHLNSFGTAVHHTMLTSIMITNMIIENSPVSCNGERNLFMQHDDENVVVHECCRPYGCIADDDHRINNQNALVIITSSFVLQLYTHLDVHMTFSSVSRQWMQPLTKETPLMRAGSMKHASSRLQRGWKDWTSLTLLRHGGLRWIASTLHIIHGSVRALNGMACIPQQTGQEYKWITTYWTWWGQTCAPTCTTATTATAMQLTTNRCHN